MVWSDQEIFKAVQTLPDEALQAYISNPEWTVARILRHIVGTMDWFYFCLTSTPGRKTVMPQTMSDVAELFSRLQGVETLIAQELNRPDELIRITDEGESEEHLRSTILAQVIYHGAEHRTQLIDALEARGFQPISFDDLTLWDLERIEKDKLNR